VVAKKLYERRRISFLELLTGEDDNKSNEAQSCDILLSAPPQGKIFTTAKSAGCAVLNVEVLEVNILKHTKQESGGTKRGFFCKLNTFIDGCAVCLDMMGTL